MEIANKIGWFAFSTISVGWGAFTTLMDYLPTELKITLGALAVGSNPVLSYSIFVAFYSLIGTIILYTLQALNYFITYLFKPPTTPAMPPAPPPPITSIILTIGTTLSQCWVFLWRKGVKPILTLPFTILGCCCRKRSRRPQRRRQQPSLQPPLHPPPLPVINVYPSHTTILHQRHHIQQKHNQEEIDLYNYLHNEGKL